MEEIAKEYADAIEAATAVFDYLGDDQDKMKKFYRVALNARKYFPRSDGERLKAFRDYITAEKFNELIEAGDDTFDKSLFEFESKCGDENMERAHIDVSIAFPDANITKDQLVAAISLMSVALNKAGTDLEEFVSQ